MVVTVMAALAGAEQETIRKRVTDSVVKHRDVGKDSDGRRPRLTNSPLRNALRTHGLCQPSCESSIG